MSNTKHRNRYLRMFALANLPQAIPVKRTLLKGHWKRCKGTSNGITGEHLVYGFIGDPTPDGSGSTRRLVDIGPALRWLNKKGKLKHVRSRRFSRNRRTSLHES